MDFAEFINAFGNGYRHINENRNTETGRITHLNKPGFCRALLCAITKNETYVSNRSDTEFQSFYRNTDRRSLHPIAETIIDHNDIDREKFKRFLEDYSRYFSKEKLLENLHKPGYLPNTTLETLFDDITTELVDILKKSAAVKDKRRKTITPSQQTTPTVSASAVNNSAGCPLIKNLNDTLQKLITLGNELYRLNNPLVRDVAQIKRLNASLHDEFKQLTESASALLFNHSAIDSSKIRRIFNYVQSMKEEDFITSEYATRLISISNNPVLQWHNRIQELQELIDDLRKDSDNSV